MRLIQRKATYHQPAAGRGQIALDVETPIERHDPIEGAYTEVLKISGMTWRGGRKQLILLDAGRRESVRNVIGSVRNLRTIDGVLLGDVRFAADAQSQVIRQKFADGHLSEFRISATPLESSKIPHGKTYLHRGREITGPAFVITKWIATDVGLFAEA